MLSVRLRIKWGGDHDGAKDAWKESGNKAIGDQVQEGDEEKGKILDTVIDLTGYSGSYAARGPQGTRY